MAKRDPFSPVKLWAVVVPQDGIRFCLAHYFNGADFEVVQSGVGDLFYSRAAAVALKKKALEVGWEGARVIRVQLSVADPQAPEVSA